MSFSSVPREKLKDYGKNKMQIIVRNIRLPLSATDGEVMEQAAKRLSPILSKSDIKRRSLYRRSVDTRHKTITLVYSVLIETDREIAQSELEKYDCAADDTQNPLLSLTKGSEPSEGRPVIVGFGPSGMFSALLLAEMGYRPIVIERGEGVLTRMGKVSRFFKTGELDTETNIQFGAGGAGTFSDGKLVTRINDSYCRYVLERLVELGAPSDVLLSAKPHIGTDKLLSVVARADGRIRELGGEIHYSTKMTGLKLSCGRATAVITENGEIPCGQVIIAIGHSARDTYSLLLDGGFEITPKPFSVGVRIEHLTEDIDRAVYGKNTGHPRLGHAEYAFSKRIGKECVYTFCMCPGGEVVAAASEEGGVVTNGMSRYKRDGKNSNSALVVAVSPDNPIDFQRHLERQAFIAGGGGYKAPMQTVGDFLNDRHGKEPTWVKPTYRGGDVTLSDFSRIFPKEITSMLKIGITDFNNKLKGFASHSAILTGVETRTSAPVRIQRGEDRLALKYDNIYPIGEGAGYAGGITSAAVDGLRTAECIIKRYAPKKG